MNGLEIDVEAIGKTISAVASLVAILVTWSRYRLKTSSNSILKQYKLDEHFSTTRSLLDNESWKEAHDLTLELWFLGSSGKRLDAEEIRFFLKNKNGPLTNLSDYINCYQKIKLVREDDTSIIRIEKKPHKLWFFNILYSSTTQSFIFFVSGLYVCFTPLIAMYFYYTRNPMLDDILLLCVISGIFAFCSLRELSRLSSMNRLVSKFSKSA